jgi:predicted TIM-barrel enzyme
MKKFFPVVHIKNTLQTLDNVLIAKDSGADGIFLIDHSGWPPDFLIASVVDIFKRDNFSIGINYLGRDNIEAMEHVAKLDCDMIWCDNAGMDDDSIEYPERFCEIQKTLNISFYGGVHFKYQNKPKKNIVDSMEKAIKYVTHPTLSGTATGVEADINFITEAYNAAKGKQLAIASGITEDNIDKYLPYIDHFLVASSIIDKTSDIEMFDEKKLINLREKIK